LPEEVDNVLSLYIDESNEPEKGEKWREESWGPRGKSENGDENANWKKNENESMNKNKNKNKS
jgi:hypothetical protein